MTTLEDFRAQIQAETDERLQAWLELHKTDVPERLHAAMGHALLAGGKRLRPLMVHVCFQTLGGHAQDDGDGREAAWRGALAVELIHTYSLVHDDLPALDDDDLRRGQPTVHRAFDEATAVLAGDGLLTDAFAWLASSPRRPAEMCLALAKAAGSAGMVGGQQIDLASEGEPKEAADLEEIHRRKTGQLLAASCVLGGLAADAEPEVLTKLEEFGELAGLAFQIADDILDVVGDESVRGKRSGGDVVNDKATYVKLLGLQEAKARAEATAQQAADLARALSGPDSLLPDLALLLARRKA